MNTLSCRNENLGVLLLQPWKQKKIFHVYRYFLSHYICRPKLLKITFFTLALTSAGLNRCIYVANLSCILRLYQLIKTALIELDVF